MILKICFEHSEIGRNQAKSPYFPTRQTSDTHLISASPIKSIAFHMPECPISKVIREYIDREEIFQRNICSVGICEYVKKEEEKKIYSNIQRC